MAALDFTVRGTGVHAFPISEPTSGRFVRVSRLDVTAKALGQVKNYGRATRRAVTWDAQSSKTLRITLNYSDRAGALALADWVGQIVVVRDPQGLVAVGLLASIDEREQAESMAVNEAGQATLPTLVAQLHLTTHPLATV